MKTGDLHLKGMKKMRFKHPYFISPHAVKQFRKRIMDLPAKTIINTLQELLQKPGLPVDAQIMESGKLVLTFQFYTCKKHIFVPVTRSAGKWPVVPTVLDEYGRLNQTIVRERRARNRMWKLKHTLKLTRLLDAGYNVEECAYILRFPINVVRQEVKKCQQKRYAQ